MTTLTVLTFIGLMLVGIVYKLIKANARLKEILELEEAERQQRIVDRHDAWMEARLQRIITDHYKARENADGQDDV